MDKLTLTVNEATALTGLGRSTIYRLINDGKLKPRKVGKRTLFLMSEIRDFIENLPEPNDSEVA